MSVRRGTARLLAAGVLLAGLVVASVTVGVAFDVTAAPPARADENSVRLRLPSGFTAGGSPGSASIAVTKRTKGCVELRSALGIRLPGLTPGQVTVETVVAGGGWRPVATSSGGADLVVTERTRPERPRLCERKSTTVRYRLTFAEAAPNGSVLVVAEVYTTGGAVVGRDSDSARVRGGQAAAAPTLPTVAPTSASPTPEASEETEVAAAPSAGTDTSAADSDDGGGFGLSTFVILMGMGMVGIGVALLVLLIRRGRAERSGGSPGTPSDAGGFGGGVATTGRPVGYPATLAGPGAAAAEPTAFLPSAYRAGQPFPPAAGRQPSGGPPPPPRQLGRPFQVAGHHDRSGAGNGPGPGPGPDATLFIATDRSAKPRPDVRPDH